MRDIHVPVLIVGGGGAGLTASMLLSTLGVESLLVSALPTTSTLPKAHVLNQRAMEILRELGIEDAVRAAGTPLAHMRYSAWYAGFAGPEVECGRRIGRAEAWGAGYTDTDWIAASPCASTNLPQIRLEPILRARAEALAPGRVCFHHEVTDLVQDDGGVTVTVVDRERDETYRVRAAYVLACDGGRTIGSRLGVELDGQRGLANEVSVHLSADLSRWARDADVLIRWIWLPETAALAVLVPMGPDHWGPESEEWVFHLNYPADDPRSFDDAQVEADMRRGLGIGDLPLRIHKITRWSLEGVLADRYQVGRVFLLGDAAHRHPPTGGLGLNSAIQDAHNLCWKLAAVLQGHAADALLASYEAERRPVAARNVRRSVENAFNQFGIGLTLGLDAAAGAEANWAQLRRLWSEAAEDTAHRRQVARAIASQSMEFREHNVEYGYDYASQAIVADGTPPPVELDAIRVYQPGTRPGRPLPHAWLDGDDGERLPLFDLIAPGRWLLITGEDGAPWQAAAHRLAAAGLPLDAVAIGHLEGDYLDPRCQWLQRREIAADGALLVRPDRCVAWRSLGAASDAHAVLAGAVQQLLGRARGSAA